MSEEKALFDLVEWGPPLGVMFAALAGGGFLAFRLRKDEAGAAHVASEAHKLDLENRRDEALQMLSALESHRSTMNPEDYAAERKALLSQGSQAMRELDQGNTGTSEPASAPSTTDTALTELTRAFRAGEIDAATYATAVATLQESAPTPVSAPVTSRPVAPPARPPIHASPADAPSPGLSPAWQGAIYALVGAGLIGGLLYFVSDASQPRRDGAGMTGNQDLGNPERPPAGTTQGAPGEPPWVAQERQKAEAALAVDPKDVTALNTLTQLNLNNPSEAWAFNEKAREADPENVDARMFEAVITSIMSMHDKAQEKFDALIEENPEHGGVWAYKGLTLLEAKRYDQAVVALEKAKTLGINDHSIDNALAAAKNGGVAPAAAPRPPMPAPGGNAGAPSATIVSGTIDIEPSRSTYKGVQLFVNISDPSRPGPPVAALRLPPGPFPMDFVVTRANILAMGGAPPTLPPSFTVKARLDDDGNAFTKRPTDPTMIVEGVTDGTKGMKLILK